MSTTKTGYWVRIVDQEVLQVWDYSPSEEQKQTEEGWKESVEIIPDTVFEREVVTTFTVNTDATPVEIVWAKRSVPVEDRIIAKVHELNFEFKNFVDAQMLVELDETENSVDLDAIAAQKTLKDDRVAQVKTATTHEELEAILATFV